MAGNPFDCLVVVHIGSTQVSTTVAWRQEEEGEVVKYHHKLDFAWSQASEPERRKTVERELQLASDGAGIKIYTAFVCITDQSLRAEFATGYADPGMDIRFTEEERDLALARAGNQPIGTGRWVIHALPQWWMVKTREGDRTVDDPVGFRGNRLTCNVLLVTIEQQVRDAVATYLEGSEVELEGIIAPPVAVHRGLASILPKRGSTIIVDCGARQTSIMVHRKQRLVHIETHRFGGEDLTQALASELGIERDRAERLKREVNLSQRSGKRGEIVGQNYLWSELQEHHSLLGKASIICNAMLRQFFRDRARILRDHSLLAQQGRVYLVGRGAALGGLAGLVKEVFDLDAVLGSHQANREVNAELADLITVGLVRSASDERARKIAERRSSGLYQVTTAASGIWSWLTEPFR